MAMHKVPTLILGIGGIGCRIAANISDLLSPEARDYVALVGIDTNVNDLAELSERGIRTIQTSDKRTVGEYLEHRPVHRPWFPLSQFTTSKTLLNGAGQIRAVSRLGALATEERGGFIPLKDEIQRIRTNRGDESNGNLTVMVVGSITGGTGAGLFLQIPYYLRKIMKGEAGLDNIIIRGMFIGPDLTVSVQPSSINRDAVRVNAYACLKELNAMYRRQLPECDMENLKIDFYTPYTKEEQERRAEDLNSGWDQLEAEESDYGPAARAIDSKTIARGNPEIPYDYLYLIENSNSDGSIGNPSISSVEVLTARMVHTLMFTPVRNNALSVEDNMVLQDAMYNGMNRYSSAGMTTLVYPQELVRDYVTLCTVRDLVRSEWLLIDDGFRDEVSEARSRQRTDGTVEIPQLKTSFPHLFTKYVTGEGRLGKLFSEAFVVIPEENDRIPRSTSYLNNIRELIEETIDRDQDLSAAYSTASMNEGRMNTFDSAAKEIRRLYSALEEYEKAAKSKARTGYIAIANELFPTSIQSMSKNRDNSRNIRRLLANVHPLTARFFCYDMICQLDSRIKRLNASIEGTDLGDYLTKDYDTKVPGTQTPLQALDNLNKKKIPILGSIGSDADKIKKLKTKIQQDTQKQQTLIKDFLIDSLDKAVCEILRNRIEALAENYAVFFKNIGTMIERNNDRIAKLEKLEMPLGQVGVYCNKTALQMINAEYQSTADSELPAETKSAIFDCIFSILATDFENKSKVRTEFQKANDEALKVKELDSIFQNAVVDSVRTDIIRKGSGIVGMNILQALECQYNLKETEESRNLSFNEYLRATINRTMKMSAPLMATSNAADMENTATAYVALNPCCAATTMDQASIGATQELLVPTATPETGGVKPTVLMDNNFSPSEIICFRAKYKFSVEHLVKYTYDSENACAYRARIANLGRIPVNTGNPDDHLTVINPHLNRNWHEEAYLPALYRNERDRETMETYKAFIYSLGLDLFQRIVDDNTLDTHGKGRTFWYYRGAPSLIRMEICNNPIGTSCNDLFESLRYNRRIKQNILLHAKKAMRSAKGYYVAEELYERIMEDPLIQDLIQAEAPFSTLEERNLLDIFLQMRDGMSMAQWEMLFSGLQNVLWEYCGFLFDKSERMVNRAVRDILHQMFSNSSLGHKSEASMTFTEKALVNQIERIGSAIYHCQ